MTLARPKELRFTFAVVGRNEASRLAGMVGLAQQAAHDGDRVWFVDSASEDDSIAVAQRLGVEVIEAPVGKGRAMAVALDRCQEGYICFLDADFFHWSVNVPATLRAAAISTGADMIVGGYSDDRRRVITGNLYWPLVDALFPDIGRRCDPTPLSGLRVIDPALTPRPLPDGYGVETFLNLRVAAAGCEISTVDLGFMRGPLRGYANVPEISYAIATEVLDFAVARGRLDGELRAAWDAWVESLVDAIGIPPPLGAPDAEYLAGVAAAANRPFPLAKR